MVLYRILTELDKFEVQPKRQSENWEQRNDASFVGEYKTEEETKQAALNYHHASHQNGKRWNGWGWEVCINCPNV